MSDWIDQQRANILSAPVSPSELTAALFTQVEQKRKYYKCGDKFVDFTTIKPISEIQTNTKISAIAAKYSNQIAIWRGDITHLECDVIVNAANEGLLGGGGIDEAIHGAAGPLLQRECASLGKLCNPGEAVITKGYKLPATYVIHTVGPYFDDSNKPQPEILAKCYESVFALCTEYRLSTIALPPISTGFYGFPKNWAANIALEETCKYLSKHPSVKVVFVGFHKKDEDAYYEAVYNKL